jgi:hypothetical protein
MQIVVVAARFMSQWSCNAPCLADLDAVMKRIIDGTPVDPETSRQIEERADRITEEIRRTRGVMDDAWFPALLHDDDDA